MNSMLTLHEKHHETKCRGQIGVVLKLNFEKAYDKVHWGFLMKCIRARGFNNTWCKWIERILYNYTITVKINGQVGSYFQVIRR
jgi:hypothetical protein